jgi:(p)ppGpp synthase/HD superfamily hydrolase
MFGSRVLELVEAATDGSAGVPRDQTTWKSRKQAHLDEMALHLKTEPEALLVPLADKLANGQAIVNDLHLVGPVVWERFNAGRDEVLWYYTSALAVFESAFGADHVLVGRLDRVVAEMSKG